MQLRKGIVALALLAGGTWATAQSMVQTREVLTNRAIVNLASAGFNQDFIIELIANSRSQFDISTTELASLAKQGINERIIRVMLNAPSGTEPLSTSQVPSPDNKSPIALVQPQPEALAISAHTPYYRSTSVLWGIYKRKIGIGAATRSRSPLIPHLGMVYESVLSPEAFVPTGRY
jgi:hypothetical protein